MNKVLEKIKDLFYDTTDYILILIIIASVAGIIAWRLDSLFDRTPKVSPSDNIIINKDDFTDTVDSTQVEENKQDNIVNITIPEGSLPMTIANILLDNNLITDRYEFLRKSQELGLDTRLRSGEFEIDKDSSTEDIIRILARQ